MQIFAIAAAVTAILWLIAICPGRGRKERMRIFSDQPVAHRGLYDNHSDAPENSLPAFSAAVEAGYGIELDVRLTKDLKTVVCHDDRLKRTAGIDRCVSEMTLEELREIRIFQSEQTVPTFHETLQTIGGRVPVVVEIKSEDRKHAALICELVQEELDSYQGAYCIESFNPAVLLWYKKKRPAILRGQLSERFQKRAFPHSLAMFLFSCCIFNCLTRPDFIAYNHKCRNLLRFRLMRDLYHPCMAAWTIKSEKSSRAAQKDFEIIIFEQFYPEVKPTRSGSK